MDDVAGNALSDAYREFERREDERARIRAELDDLAGRIAEAETRLGRTAVFGSYERLALARARVDVLSARREIDRLAEDAGERALRARHRVLTGHRAAV